MSKFFRILSSPIHIVIIAVYEVLQKAAFLALIDEHNPDVICGCESHLDQSFYASEIFPDIYNVFRKDCTMGGGGVFLCIKKYLQVLEKPQLDVEAELIWVN